MGFGPAFIAGYQWFVHPVQYQVGTGVPSFLRTSGLRFHYMEHHIFVAPIGIMAMSPYTSPKISHGFQHCLPMHIGQLDFALENQLCIVIEGARKKDFNFRPRKWQTLFYQSIETAKCNGSDSPWYFT